jgi:hypothetical protein
VLEFRRRETGRPFLPYSFELQPDPFLPVCFDGQGDFLSDIQFLGRTYSLAETERSAPATGLPKARVIELSDDLLVGTSRNARDVDGRRIPRRAFVEDWSLDYAYRPLDERDLERMLAAGFNYFDRVLPEQLE